jgi:hypothetical protein
MNTLLQVVAVHHPGNEFATQAAKAVRRVFGAEPDETLAPGGLAVESIWNAVRVTFVTGKESLETLQLPENGRVLWLLLVDYPMTDGSEWPAITAAIGQRIEAAMQIPDQSRVGALIWGERSALDRLPDSLRNLQGTPQAQLGENRIAPHRLALLALHRARLLLGRTPGKNALKLFISHAKADGVFFADALKSAVDQVPELKTWYDAEDIHSGTLWKKELKENASSSVFIAIRTEAYSRRPACLEEFHWALEHGVPIVVVDALVRPDIAPAPLPFASMPTVRVPDGNTHRVLVAALREQLRILLVETQVAEESALRVPNLPASAWRVWPRLPAFNAIQGILAQHLAATPCCIVIADTAGPEINAAVGVLQGLRTPAGDPVLLTLTTADYFAAYAIQLAAAVPPIDPPPP